MGDTGVGGTQGGSRTQVVAGAEDDEDGVLTPHGLGHGGGLQDVAHHHPRWGGALLGQAPGVPHQHGHRVPWGGGR